MIYSASYCHFGYLLSLCTNLLNELINYGTSNMEKCELIIITMQTEISLCMKWDTPLPYHNSAVPHIIYD